MGPLPPVHLPMCVYGKKCPICPINEEGEKIYQIHDGLFYRTENLSNLLLVDQRILPPKYKFNIELTETIALYLNNDEICFHCKRSLGYHRMKKVYSYFLPIKTASCACNTKLYYHVNCPHLDHCGTCDQRFSVKTLVVKDQVNENEEVKEIDNKTYESLMRESIRTRRNFKMITQNRGQKRKAIECCRSSDN